jgi:hypothetical protein
LCFFTNSLEGPRKEFCKEPGICQWVVSRKFGSADLVTELFYLNLCPKHKDEFVCHADGWDTNFVKKGRTALVETTLPYMQIPFTDIDDKCKQQFSRMACFSRPHKDFFDEYFEFVDVEDSESDEGEVAKTIVPELLGQMLI